MQAVTMGTQTSRATYSRLLVNSFIFGYSFHSVNLILAALILLIACQCGQREGIVEPPVDQRRHGGEAGGDELLELGALDGQHGLAQSAQDLVDEGQSQHSGAGDGGSGDGAGGDDFVSCHRT